MAQLRRSSLEALKQCGSGWVPAIDELVSLQTFLQRPRSGPGWLAEISGLAPPSVLDSRPLTVVVGPEGGLTEDERKAIIDVGYQSVTSGPIHLRFETAAIAAAAAAGQARLRGSMADCLFCKIVQATSPPRSSNAPTRQWRSGTSTPRRRCTYWSFPPNTLLRCAMPVAPRESVPRPDTGVCRRGGK